MSGVVEVGGDISAAATALAGLLLVFLGAIAVAFEGYQPQERNPIRGRYQRRDHYMAVSQNRSQH